MSLQQISLAARRNGARSGGKINFHSERFFARRSRR